MAYFKKSVINQTLQVIYDEIMQDFKSMGRGFRYSEHQKNFAFDLIDRCGIRATAKVLQMPRRTLQRWCRTYDIAVKRCPSWVYDWVSRRKKRREFWARRGYG